LSEIFQPIWKSAKTREENPRTVLVKQIKF